MNKLYSVQTRHASSIKIFAKIGGLFLLLSLFFACSPIRKTYKEPLKEKGTNYIFDQLKDNEFDFEWLSAKYEVEIREGKKKSSFKGTIRIRKDSLIWMSVSPALGIEIARVKICRDSVLFINRIESSYFSGDFKYINKLFNTDFDFDMLQTLLIGNSFSYYEKEKFKSRIDRKQYMLSTIGRGKLKKAKESNDDKIISQNLWLNPETFRINKLSIKVLKENRKMEVVYDDFETIETQLFPKNINLKLSDKKSIIINIKFSKLSLNERLRFPFKVLSKYKRM